MGDMVVTGAAGSFFMTTFHFLYGEGYVRYLALVLFVGLIVLDWIAGYRASKIDSSYSSECGINGAFRTAFILIPDVGHLIDQIFGTPGIAFGFLIAAFGLHYMEKYDG